MKKIIAIVCLAVLCGTRLQADDHFINDQSYREKMAKAFDEKMTVVGKKFFDAASIHTNQEELEALMFLYAYMPLADVTDYPTSFFLENVRSSIAARNEMEWGRKVPELLFRHFVVPIRVNNEALDNSRMVFYDELKQRVAGKSMYDAILEVNHWCHEKVTYQPSDARTSSPLATVKTATGRCGEQSTFTVAALRAVGIPARQVYTPRWAHTDDNHAWVEAWADGTWYFLGACEPEAVLNLGWFNAPASRAMLMHTRAFGDYNGPEEVMLRTSNFTEINLTDNYAATATVEISVSDEKGLPVDNARVDFKIYNYAEFYTAVTKYTDAKGQTTIKAGKGDMLVWVSKDGKYAYKKVSFGKDKSISIVLKDNTAAPNKSVILAQDTMTIVPPVEKAVMPKVSDAQREANKKRLAYEDSIRKAYTATFLTKEKAEQINPKAADLLVKSRGNHETIEAFLSRHTDNQERAIELLSSLSDKDLRDITSEILEDSYTAESSQLCPRVEDEMIISPFKHYLAEYFDNATIEKFRQNPAEIAIWIKANVYLYPDTKALQIAQTPMGAMKAHMTDNRSRDILYVDIARSLDIEARKDEVTSKVQYRKGGEWIDVKFDDDTQKQTPKGRLVLNYEPTKFLDNPMYYSHFTVSKIESGITKLLNMDEGEVDMGGGASWSNTFKDGVTLDCGTYMLTTGTRLANGSVLATNKIFTINEGETVELDLEMRQSTSDVSVIGSFNSESLYSKDGKDVSILSQTGRGYFIVGVIGVGQEPSNHALHDIEKLKDQFEKWNRPLLLLFENEEAARHFSKEEFASLPSTTIFGIDKDKQIASSIAAQMKLMNSTQLPIFIIADTFNRVVFVSQGYTIGLGEQLINTIKKL